MNEGGNLRLQGLVVHVLQMAVQNEAQVAIGGGSPAPVGAGRGKAGRVPSRGDRRSESMDMNRDGSAPDKVTCNRIGDGQVKLDSASSRCAIPESHRGLSHGGPFHPVDKDRREGKSFEDLANEGGILMLVLSVVHRVALDMCKELRDVTVKGSRLPLGQNDQADTEKSDILDQKRAKEVEPREAT